jgi:hypothetical protein
LGDGSSSSSSSSSSSNFDHEAAVRSVQQPRSPLRDITSQYHHKD